MTGFCDLLAAGYRRTRPAAAALLELGTDQADDDIGGLVLALSHGLMLQATLGFHAGH